MSPALQCHYCGCEVLEAWEFQRDHFPRPKSKGGKVMVIACNKCHHKKDRAPGEELLAEFEKVLRTDLDHPIVRGAYRSWEAFINDHDDGCAEVAARTARRNWRAWPIPFRILAGRMLRDMEW